MGRKSKKITLAVYLQGNLVGEYIKTADGQTQFSYHPEWVKAGFPISQSLPLITTPYKGDIARAYFENLLPDLREVRESIAAKVRANSSDHFDLLMTIGHDCVGALLFSPQELAELPSLDHPEGTLLTEKQIAELIRNLKSRPLGMNEDLADFRISLAGVQEKTALLFWNNQWHLPSGITPTTHIIKPPMKFETHGLDMRTSVHNEYFCMKMCKQMGLRTADVELANFDGELVLVVERFDRIIKQGNIYRRPQEDMCQALGCFSHRKYQSDGGPGVKEIVSILQSSVQIQQDLESFFKSLVVFHVLGAIDGHAKNYSIEYVPKGHRLAPLYDVLSIFPALDEKSIAFGKFKMAIGIGNSNHYRVHKISRRHFIETAKMCLITAQRASEIIDEVQAQVQNQIWTQIQFSPLFNQAIADKIITGMKIIAKNLN